MISRTVKEIKANSGVISRLKYHHPRNSMTIMDRDTTLITANNTT
jgi:hypothetical protein